MKVFYQIRVSTRGKVIYSWKLYEKS